MSRSNSTFYGSLVIIAASVWGIVVLRLGWGGHEELPKHAAYDVSAHLLTALVIAVALRAAHVRFPMWAVLIGGILPAVGQFTTIIGITHAIDGSSCNGSQSVLALLIVPLAWPVSVEMCSVTFSAYIAILIRIGAALAIVAQCTRFAAV